MPQPSMPPQASRRQIDWRGIFSLMDSANTDPELTHWLHWAEEGGKVPMFVRTVATAARMACMPDYVLLRPVLVELKRQHPEPEPGRPLAVPIRYAGSVRPRWFAPLRTDRDH